MRATVGPGEIIIRDKDKQAELEASGQTEDLAGLNRDPGKAYENTKDKHVEIDYYLSDTSIKHAYEAGKTVVDVIGNAVDRMINDGKLDPSTANLKPYLNDPDVLSQLDQCRNQASADYNPFDWIVTSAYAGAMCSIKTAGGVIAIGSSDAALMSGLQAEAALGFGLAGLVASGVLLLTTEQAGDYKDQTVTLANGTVVSVTGVGDQLDRNVSIMANGNDTRLLVRDDGFGGLIISGGSINGQSMTYGELERARRDLNNAGYNVVLTESSGQRPSKTLTQVNLVQSTRILEVDKSGFTAQMDVRLRISIMIMITDKACPMSMIGIPMTTEISCVNLGAPSIPNAIINEENGQWK